MDVEIIGTGITGFGMFVQTRMRELAARAVDQALEDAGVTGDEVDLVVFGNAAAGLLTGQEMIRAHTALGGSRVAGRPMVSVENACASSSSAVHLAAMVVASGAYRTVLAVGAEKMTSHDRSRASRALGTAVDVEVSGEADGSRPVFMDIYAAEARDYQERGGATVHDFALIAAKNYRNGSLNPIAQNRTALTVEEVLAARTIAAPLTRPMCSSIGDGAAACVLTSSALAGERGRPGVRLLASALGASTADDLGDIVSRTARTAFEQAGLGPEDIDLCELHDAASPAELIIMEEVGLAMPGEAVKLVREGVTAIGGRLPVNPSGGLLARGHPVGATGAAQIVELADQLRGRAGARQIDHARIGLSENAGGWLANSPAACVVTILGAPRS